MLLLRILFLLMVVLCISTVRLALSDQQQPPPTHPHDGLAARTLERQLDDMINDNPTVAPALRLFWSHVNPIVDELQYSVPVSSATDIGNSGAANETPNLERREFSASP